MNAIAPRTVLAATAAGSGGESNVAFLVPALLGLAAFALAGTVLLRRRRLSSRLAP